jgi:hypothetical protein
MAKIETCGPETLNTILYALLSGEPRQLRML